MANKKSFEDRIKESEVFIEAGDFKSAISTLIKAKGIDSIKAKAIDLDNQIKELQNRQEVHLKEETTEQINDLNQKADEEIIEKVEEELKENVVKDDHATVTITKKSKKSSGDPNEGIDFVFDAPAGVCFQGELYMPGVHRFHRKWKEGLLTIPGVDHAVEDE